MNKGFECKGKWKLPENNDWIFGTLTFDPESGGQLELFGTFNRDITDQSSKEIIIGLTDLGEITLIDNWFSGIKTSNGIVIGKYEPIRIIKGHHFESENEINFERVIFKVFNLFQWFDITGQTHEFKNSDSTSYSIHYDKINEIPFVINENCSGVISFDAPVHFQKNYNSVSLREEAYVMLSYTKKTNYLEIIKDITNFIDLITLFAFEQSYPISITLKDANYTTGKRLFEKEKYIHLFYKTSFYNKKHKLRHPGNHVVKYSNININLPTIIEKWFTFYNEIEDVISLMLSHFKTKHWFSTDKFLETIKALESFHRKYYNNERVPSEQFEAIKSSILEQVELEENDIKWLKSKLIGNEPHLVSRLKELVNDNKNKFIIENIESLDKFCYKVTDSRNYYTHYSPHLKKRALNDSKLYEITRISRGLLFSCILKKLEIENNDFEDGLKINLY
ncbi:ApeA N-terminal domain 1-containing protein [Wenyingzhuangia sp. IMCC45574]